MIALSGVVAALPGGARCVLPDLDLPKGGRLAVTGPSGAGKTTLLRAVAGLADLAQGEARTAELDMTRAPEGARRAFRLARIGLVLQDFDLIDHLTALENIRLPARLARREGRDGAARAAALGEALGIGAALQRRPERLSQGERQRVAIARALHGAPEIVLADEATAALDAENARRAVDLILAEADRTGATVVAVTHDPLVASRFPQRLRLEPATAP